MLCIPDQLALEERQPLEGFCIDRVKSRNGSAVVDEDQLGCFWGGITDDLAFSDAKNAGQICVRMKLNEAE
jgi:hypothetical protein